MVFIELVDLNNLIDWTNWKTHQNANFRCHALLGFLLLVDSKFMDIANS